MLIRPRGLLGRARRSTLVLGTPIVAVDPGGEAAHRARTARRFGYGDA